MNQKECFIPANVNLRDVLLNRSLAESPFARFLFPQNLAAITTKAITYSLIVFSHFLPLISLGSTEYNCGLNPLRLK